MIHQDDLPPLRFLRVWAAARGGRMARVKITEPGQILTARYGVSPVGGEA